MESEHTVYPRVLKPQLKDFRGKPVTIVGRIIEIKPTEQIIILEVDPECKTFVSLAKAQIKVKATKVDLGELRGVTFIEVFGIVSPGREDAIQMDSYSDFKDNFGNHPTLSSDMKTYIEVVKISTDNFKKLFMAH